MEPHRKPATSQAQILDQQGTEHIAKGEFFLAILSYSAAIHQDPTLASAHNHRGVAMAEMGELHQAIDNFDAAITLAPDRTNAHLNRSITKARLYRTKEALADLAILTAKHGPDADIHYTTGYVHSIGANHKQAITHYTSALRLDPNHLPARYNRALDYLHLGDLEQAYREFTMITTTHPAHRQAAAHRDTLASTLAKQGGER